MDTDYYKPIYDWEREKILKNQWENPYYYLIHTKHSGWGILFQKVKDGYPLYPPVDEEFINARCLAFETSKVTRPNSKLSKFHFVQMNHDKEMT